MHLHVWHILSYPSLQEQPPFLTFYQVTHYNGQWNITNYSHAYVMSLRNTWL